MVLAYLLRIFETQIWADNAVFPIHNIDIKLYVCSSRDDRVYISTGCDLFFSN